MVTTARTRYTTGGTVETNSVGIGFWTRATFPKAADDIEVELTEQTASRLNILTKQLYGRDNLVWLVWQYNNILDPVAEIYPGRIIKLPNPARFA